MLFSAQGEFDAVGKIGGFIIGGSNIDGIFSHSFKRLQKACG